jgi:hypothetical protein
MGISMHFDLWKGLLERESWLALHVDCDRCEVGDRLTRANGLTATSSSRALHHRNIAVDEIPEVS